MLDLGQGVTADPRQAFAWIERAAAQDYSLAFVSMAVMHANGRGTPKDYAKARSNYLKGARAGEPHAFYGIGVLYNLGQGVKPDKVEALAWFMVAATLGNAEAHSTVEKFNLGDAATRAAVDRGNAIFEEFGLRHRIHFGNPDAEAAAPTT